MSNKQAKKLEWWSIARLLMYWYVARMLGLQLKPWIWWRLLKRCWRIISIRWTGRGDRSTTSESTRSTTSFVRSTRSSVRRTTASSPRSRAVWWSRRRSRRCRHDHRRPSTARLNARRCSCVEVPGSVSRSRTRSWRSRSWVRRRKVRRYSDVDLSQCEDKASWIIVRDMSDSRGRGINSQLAMPTWMHCHQVLLYRPTPSSLRWAYQLNLMSASNVDFVVFCFTADFC